MRRRHESRDSRLSSELCLDVGSLSCSPPPSPSESRTTYSVTAADASPSLGRGWKQDLFLLQERAPRPRPIPNVEPLSGLVPAYYGAEFHGVMERDSAARLLLASGDGAFLVRESSRAPGSYTLAMCFDGEVLNYRLYYDGQHYVGEKRFDRILDLVFDGLISMFVSKHAGEYIAKMSEEAVYEESPYSQYQRMASMPGRAAPSSRASFVDGDAPLLLQEKAHKFKAATFRVAQYCDYCRNFMWGLVQQGLRCEDCGFAAHKKCAEKTRLDCQPHLRYVKRIFSVDLTTLCMAHKVPIPPVLDHCVRELQRRGLDVEGLYRVSGSHDDIAKLRALYDTQGQRAPDALVARLARVEDVHTVAGLLKLYLRLLPIPLIPLAVYRALLDRLRNKQPDEFREVLASQLSAPHYATLRLLMNHLHQVATHSAHNKMSPENLARIFAPTLLCAASPQGAQPSLPPTGQQDQYLLHYLITKQSEIFP